MIIHGTLQQKRVSSQQLEEHIQKTVHEGTRTLEVQAQGQHGIGGRIWPKKETVSLKVKGPVGQRLGAMGMPGTEIVVQGNASDDVGWLNCGAHITVLGDVTNGAHNAGAQGVLYVQGSGGARCDTMTKQNPRFAPLQSWYFRNVGDSFAEFKAGGIAVICGVEPRNQENVLGYRPCVGMVGGTIYVRGPMQQLPSDTVQVEPLDDTDWDWLTENIPAFLKAIKRTSFRKKLTSKRDEWRKIRALSPQERAKLGQSSQSIKDFRRRMWEKEVGKGGIFGDMLSHPPFRTIPYTATGANRLMVPHWEDNATLPPCAGACPADIPSAARFALLAEGKFKEAAELVFQFSPFPASVCGSVCPNMCMSACTRNSHDAPLNIKALGLSEENSLAPPRAPSTSHKIAVIGAGPAGLTAAWILALKGHAVHLYESANRLGGKLWDAIDKGKLQRETLVHELNRIKNAGVEIFPEELITPQKFEHLCAKYDGIIITCGIQKKDGRGLRFLSTDIECVQGKIKTNKMGQTSNPKVFAAGDVLHRGLPPHAIGQGRKSALALDAVLSGTNIALQEIPTLSKNTIRVEYYPVEPLHPHSSKQFYPQEEAKRCFSCGLCRDCRMCEQSCHSQAIRRETLAAGGFRYVVDSSRCIGCGFCAGICPCGIWSMHQNRQDTK